MTKIITGNENPSELNLLNPKIFNKQRVVKFNGSDLTDNKNDLKISFSDYKEEIVASSFEEKEIKPYFYGNVECKEKMVINSKNLSEAAYRIIGFDRESVVINNIIDFDFSNITFLQKEYVECDLTISFVPFNGLISPDSDNKEMKSLYTKVTGFIGYEQIPYAISDLNHFRKIVSTTIKGLKLIVDKNNENTYCLDISKILTTNDKKYSYNIYAHLYFSKDERTFDVYVKSFYLMGLIDCVDKSNIFIARKPSENKREIENENSYYVDIHNQYTSPYCTSNFTLYGQNRFKIRNIIIEDESEEGFDMQFFYINELFIVFNDKDNETKSTSIRLNYQDLITEKQMIIPENSGSFYFMYRSTSSSPEDLKKMLNKIKIDIHTQNEISQDEIIKNVKYYAFALNCEEYNIINPIAFIDCHGREKMKIKSFDKLVKLDIFKFDTKNISNEANLK